MLQRVFVWSGGALFAVALAFCAWSFVGPWGRTGGLPVVGRAIVVDSVLFVAVRRTSQPVRTHLGQNVHGTVGVCTGASFGVRVDRQHAPAARLRSPGGRSAASYTAPAPSPRCSWSAVQLGGLAITCAAVRVIDPLELAGIRPPATTTIEFSGPYRWVRHPFTSVGCCWCSARRHDRRQTAVRDDLLHLSAGGDPMGRTAADVACGERTVDTRRWCAGE